MVSEDYRDSDCAQMVWDREFRGLIEVVRGSHVVNDAGLSYGEVFEIMGRLKDGYSVEKIAQEFCCAPVAIRLIATRKMWA